MLPIGAEVALVRAGEHVAGGASVFSVMARFTENKRRLIVVELSEMVEHERDARAAAALAASTGGADPTGPDLLQCVATEDAATITTPLASDPRLPRMLKAVSLFGRRSGGTPNSRAVQVGQ